MVDPLMPGLVVPGFTAKLFTGNAVLVQGVTSQAASVTHATNKPLATLAARCLVFHTGPRFSSVRAGVILVDAEYLDLPPLAW